MGMESKTVGVCPRCGHPVHWMWAGNSAKTRRPCPCCGYRGFVILRTLGIEDARERVTAMHERAMRDWQQGKQPPVKLVFGVGR